MRKILRKLNPKEDSIFMGYALKWKQSIWMSGGKKHNSLKSNYCAIIVVLIEKESKLKENSFQYAQ